MRARITKVPVTKRGHRVYGGEAYRDRRGVADGGVLYLATIPQGWLDVGIEVRASSRQEAKDKARAIARRDYGYADLRFAN